MDLNKSAFAGIPRTNRSNSAQDALTENMEVLTGQRGNKGNRALLYSDLVSLDDMKRKALINSITQTPSGSLPLPVVGGIDSPTAPVNLSGTGGFTFIALTWDHPLYKGHAYAEIYRSETDTFGSATRIATEVTDIFSDAVNMGVGYYYWVRFVNKADVKGPIQGANGLYVETQQSAAQILGEIGGLIEKSHLSEILTNEVNKIPDLSVYIEELKIDIPELQLAMFDASGVVEQTKTEAALAKEIANATTDNTESMALRLIDAALIGDENWRNNTTKLIDIQASIEGVQATVTSEFYTKTEANEAIAAAATTIQTMVEANGVVLSGDLASTYYTKTTADEAIALADLALKTAIENPNGSSIGATLNNDYYTSANTDSAISVAGDTLKAIIEDPSGASVGAVLFNDYYTKVGADNAISSADLVLKSDIEDPNGDSIGATLYSGYYTKTDTNQAISSASVLLKANIEDPNGDSIGATLFNHYETKVDNDASVAVSINELSSSFNPAVLAVIDNAIGNDIAADNARLATASILSSQKTIADETKSLAQSLQTLSAQFGQSEATTTKLTQSFADNIQSYARDLLQLNSRFESATASLEQNYYTKASADEAISTATTILKTTIDGDIGSLTSDLQTNYYTKTSADTAISNATTQLKSVIDGDIGAVSADLYQNFYTKTTADTAISTANLALKSTIDSEYASADVAVLNVVDADLQTNYYTKVTTDTAISNATTQLKAAIENPSGSSVGANLQNNYFTKADVNEAVSSATLALQSTIATDYEAADEAVQGNVNTLTADLQTNYRTSTNTDLAISQAITQLKSTIEDVNGSSVTADLYQNFYTSTEADTAISTASTTLKAEIEDANGSSVGATLQTLSETVATNDEQWAMWGVKTTVNELTASFGLINDGLDPIFAIKGAKFAIITDQTPNVATPVFAVVDGKTVIKSALIDDAYIKTLVTDDLLSNRIVVGSELNAPSINYNKTTGARSHNFSLDPSGNMVAKSATLESVTIKDSNGNVVMSSTGAVPYSNVSGTPALGDLAALSTLDYNAITGKPTLGTLAALDNLGYDSLTGKPTLGTFAALNSLEYDSLTGKPVLGSLAALSSLAYDSITGKPVLGPFAGLAKLLSTNVSTYIESGAIGSAQIDQAYITSLFGENASFSGTVYAEKITGDLIDGDVTSVYASAVSVGVSWTTIKTISVQRNADFDVWLTIDDLIPEFNAVAGFGALHTRLYYAGQTGKAVSITQGTSMVTVNIQVKKMELTNSEVPVETYVPTQNAVLQMFRKGSGFIV